MREVGEKIPNLDKTITGYPETRAPLRDLLGRIAG
jgi:hypothetical protein